MCLKLFVFGLLQLKDKMRVRMKGNVWCIFLLFEVFDTKFLIVNSLYSFLIGSQLGSGATWDFECA